MFEREVVQLQGVRSAGPGVSCVALKAAFTITSRSQFLSFCVVCFIKLRLRTVLQWYARCLQWYTYCPGSTSSSRGTMWSAVYGGGILYVYLSASFR